MCPGEAPPCPGDISRSSAAFLQEDALDPHTHVQHRRESCSETAPARLLPPSSWDRTRLLLCQVSCHFSSSSPPSVAVKNALSPLWESVSKCLSRSTWKRRFILEQLFSVRKALKRFTDLWGLLVGKRRLTDTKLVWFGSHGLSKSLVYSGFNG